MRSLHNEDLELQIKLAKLQTDVQISMTACFTYLGLIGVFLIALQQSFAAIPESQTAMKYSFLAAFTVMAVLFFLIGRLCVKEIREKRKEILELKKQYVW
jgi:VIT1/CCC1 family predicted Fe2+/Mn2+ transporter